jgi:hypothetical protein
LQLRDHLLPPVQPIVNRPSLLAIDNEENGLVTVAAVHQMAVPERQRVRAGTNFVIEGTNLFLLPLFKAGELTDLRIHHLKQFNLKLSWLNRKFIDNPSLIRLFRYQILTGTQYHLIRHIQIDSITQDPEI